MRNSVIKTRENMKTFGNNRVSKIKIPEGVKSGHGFDYNPVLDLYATMHDDDGISVWSPVSGKVTAECNLGLDGDLHMLFLPGDRIAISYSEPYNTGDIFIFSLEKSTFELKLDSAELDIKVPSLCYPGAIALSPERNILVTGSEGLDPDSGLYEICMDWDNLKVLKTRKICIPEGEESEYGIDQLCDSPYFKVITNHHENSSTLSISKVCFNSEGEDEREDEEEEKIHLEMVEQATITYYMLDGEVKLIDDITGFVHDGKNLIIANGDEIVLLESITEGSNAHRIATGVEPLWQLRLNHKGQLIVCEEEAIKLFEYNCSPRSLQDLCRCCVRKTISTGYVDAVKGLEIPSTLKEYLLYI